MNDAEEIDMSKMMEATTIPDPDHTSVEEPPPTGKARKGSRSFSITFGGSSGATLRAIAQVKKDGSAVTYMVHTTKTAGGKKHAERGAVERHVNLDLAKRVVEGRLAALAVKRGWVRKERAAGFAPKPDAFGLDSVPAAGQKK
jgi:hypothetical protein